MLDSLCIIFMTGYFKYTDGTYNPVPEETQIIEIRTEHVNAYMKKVNDKLWVASINGRFFYSTMEKFTNSLCKIADNKKLPNVAYEERSILSEN